MVKLRKQLVPTYTSGTKLYAKGRHRNAYVGYSGTNERKWIVIHETDNWSKGAGAATHANLQSNGNSRVAGWHYEVDDSEAVQSFPHTARVFHAGNPNGNRNGIGIEMCVNSDNDYIQTVKNTAELVRMIMEQENIPITNVVQHNHFSGKHCPRFLREGRKGINWNDFINLVKGTKVEVEGATSKVVPSTKGTGGKSVEELAQEVIAGKHGTGDARKRSLGDKYSAVQKRVNEILGGGSKPKKTKKSVSQVAQEVIDGKWGNNPQRKQRLQSAGYNYSAVQSEVNRILGGGGKKSTPRKSVEQMAREVIAGKHGNGHETRRKSLGISEAEYEKVRKRVNQLA